MKFTIAQGVAAIKRHGGILSLAALDLQVSRQALHQRIRESAELQAAVEEATEETLDIAEGHVVKGVRRGDRTMVTYYLDRKGGKRGYKQKVETEAALSDRDLTAIVAAFGGDIEKLRAARDTLGSDGKG
ncbi:MAG: hypothetical protein GC190_19455 [Alphaproteobacteria bacterium]|nr:hypothetical protein [Alphaproteobacteria bacterium]